jgi:short-subunit dehydrogenase
MTNTILITGAGSGFGKSIAIDMARIGHTVIATTQFPSQVAPLREAAAALGLKNVRFDSLDLADPYDIKQAQDWDFDILWNNTGTGEAAPFNEIPIELVRRTYEVNVFLPLVLTQSIVQKWVRDGKNGKVIFTSSMGGLFTPANWSAYVSTKHALKSIAEALRHKLSSCGIDIHTIDLGAYHNGQDETAADSPFYRTDDAENAAGHPARYTHFDEIFASRGSRLGFNTMTDRPIEIIPTDIGKFRNVASTVIEGTLNERQLDALENRA